MEETRVVVVHQIGFWEGAKLGAGLSFGPVLLLLMPLVALAQLVRRLFRGSRPR